MNKGGLPHTSCIERKIEPLGVEFNSAEYSNAGIVFSLDIHRDKKSKLYSAHIYLNPMTACFLCFYGLCIYSGWSLSIPILT